jgi:hypothetical protein
MEAALAMLQTQSKPIVDKSIDSYDHSVEFLQRASMRSQSKVYELTPWHWKRLFVNGYI